MRIVTGENAKNEVPAISYLIEQRLRALSVAQEPDVMVHPDEDTITAFVESRLGAEESSPLVSHLVACGVCRRMTAQLARLETELQDDEVQVNATESTSRISSFLDGIASRLGSPEGDVVFAYQNPEGEAAEETADSEASADLESEPKNSEDSN